MVARVEDRYFEWLYAQFGAVSNRNPARSYWNLCQQLHSREFVWLVRNDDNRVEDGKALRYEFIRDQGNDGVDVYWLELGCSMLEMFVALAGRASYATDREPGEWIWKFLQNLHLDKFNDANWKPSSRAAVDQKIDTMVYRTYAPTGRGGLFPLRNPAEDQTKVELWYQMSAYLLEHFNF